MAILLFDENNMVNVPALILESKGGRRYGNITNFTDFVYKNQLNAANEISFTVYKYKNGKINHLWNDITDLKTVYIPEYKEKFQISVSYCDEESEIKSVSGIALCEAELGQIYLRNFECNTDDDLERNHYSLTKFYDEKNTALSLLHRVLHDKASHFKIGNVAGTLKNLSYEFSADETSIYDFLTGDVAKQAHCIFEFDSMTRTINVYDLYSTCKHCREEIIGKTGNECPPYRDDFHDVCPKCGSTDITEGYGHDTTILISKDNLSTSVTRETDVDSLKNCIYVEGGDDTIDTAFILANPNGSQYVYYFSPEVLAEMPEEFVDAYTSYNKLYDEYYYGSDNTIIDTTKTTHIINAEGNMSPGSFDPRNPDSNYVTDFNEIIGEIKDLSANTPYSDVSSYTGKMTLKGQAELVTAYYNAIDFESFLQTKMMPVYEMEEYDKYHALSLLTAKNIGTIGIPDFEDYTAKTVIENAILQAVKPIINTALYKADIHTGSYKPERSEWTGTFIITDLLNDDDTTNSITNTNYRDVAAKENHTVTDTISPAITLVINSDFITYTKNRIHYILAKKDLPTAIDLYKPGLSCEEFASEIKYHSIDNLTLFYNVITSCRDVLQEVKEKVTDTANDVYKKIAEYDEAYCEKMKLINRQIAVRENQVKTVHNYGNLIYAFITDIQKILNFRSYLEDYAAKHNLSVNLWDIFNYYRRESTYKNENIISDSLKTNADILKYAGYLMGFAKKEAIKLGTPQLTISTTLNNLLMLPEFKPILNDFNVGNWIRVKTDIQENSPIDFIYKLRLLSYTVKYDAPEQINVEFSTVSQTWSGLRDVSEIIKSAQSAASSISTISQQLDRSMDAYHTVNNWVNDGLDLTNQMIVSDAYNQSLILDEHGLLARKYDAFTDTYDDCQLKIFNNGLYTTHDGWKTINAGVGKFIWKNPANNWKEEETYGIIAKKIVGEQILGEDLKIVSGSGSVSITGDGIVINNGTITWGTVNSPEISDINGLSQSLNTITGNIKQLDGRIQTYSQEDDPKTNSKTKWTDAENEKHIGDVWMNTNNGIVFVYTKEGSTYQWVETQDSNLKKLAQSKAQIFTSKDVICSEGYHKGDLWVLENDDVMEGYCKGTILVAKCNANSGNTFNPGHWEETTVKNATDTEIKLNNFRENINKLLNANVPTTQFDDDFIFSPNIGGGYLYIKNPNDGRSVTINPEQTYSGNENILEVTNKNGDIVISADSNGEAYFNGEIHATKGSFCTTASDESFVKLNDGRMIIGEGNVEYGRIDYSNNFESLKGIGIINRLENGGYLALGHTRYNQDGSYTSLIDYYIDSTEVENPKHIFSGTSYFRNVINGNLNGCSAKLARNGDINFPMTFHWEGQSRQPTWLWGGENGSDMYVYNPSNFNVDSAKMLKSAISHDISNNTNTYYTCILTSNGNFRPYQKVTVDLDTMYGATTSENIEMNLGTKENRWDVVYANNIDTTNLKQTSDRSLKDNITPLTEKHVNFFMQLLPVSFTFKDGTSGRTHIGFIAQDVEKAMNETGLTDIDFAGFCKDRKTTSYLNDDGTETEEPVLDKNGNPEYVYSLRYTEFIALITYVLQDTIKKYEYTAQEVHLLNHKYDKLASFVGYKEANYERKKF